VTKSYAQKLMVLGAAGAAAGMASSMLSSTGVDGASPDMSGKTFSEAQAALGAMPTAGQVFPTLSCYNARDAAPGQATGSGDINTKPGS